jgi:hypothetical protein
MAGARSSEGPGGERHTPASHLVAGA